MPVQLGCVCYCFACTGVVLCVHAVCCRYIDFTCIHAFIDGIVDRYHTRTDNISQEFLLFTCLSITVSRFVLDMPDKYLMLESQFASASLIMVENLKFKSK